MSRDEFISAATALHGDRYDYSQVREEDVLNNTNTPIHCPEHGTFWETPYQHLHGMIHCPGCHKAGES